MPCILVFRWNCCLRNYLPTDYMGNSGLQDLHPEKIMSHNKWHGAWNYLIFKVPSKQFWFYENSSLFFGILNLECIQCRNLKQYIIENWMQQFLPTKSHFFLNNSGNLLHSFGSSELLCLLFSSVLLQLLKL